MNRTGYAVVIATLLATGCASAPQQTAEDGRAETARAEGGAATAAAEPGVSANANDVLANEALANEVLANRVLVVDARETPDPGLNVTCREMLKQGSNVIITQCMSQDDWKKFKRRQARDAAEIVRMLQGSAYR
jgi:hypothetical protein